MITVENQIECLSREVTELYFKERDYARLSFYLSDQITWIGTGKNEVCLSVEEAHKFFQKEMDIYGGHFIVLNEWYEVRQLANDVCLTMAVLKVRGEDEEMILPEDGLLRFSVVWIKQTNGWKIIHVHNSIPAGIQGEEFYFNYNVAKSQYAKMADDIRRASFIDPLTKINNLQGFEYAANEILQKEYDQHYVLIKFGIRDFRFVNRKFSYQTGDQVLKNIAENLQRTLHQNETCGRMEKDIFAMLYRYENKEQLEDRLENVRKQLIDRRMVRELGMEIHLNAGLYLIKDNRKEYIKDMTDRALMAMQSISKTLSGSHYVYYEDGMMSRQYYKSKILEDAPAAMDDDEFQLYIQPQFNIHTLEIISGEALTRWKLKNGSLRMPDDFVPVFEEYGMILSFDFYMLEKVCQRIRMWIDRNIQIAPISINQSRLHIEEKSYLNDFCSVVDKYEIPHHYIAFELTESAFVESSERMMQLANELHKKGFQLAIDDFGTGYASLNLLSVVSADILKIDRSLLIDCHTNPRSKIIMEKIIELAHQMDMTVICEGIETREQLEFVRAAGCDIGQGYLVGKPVHADEFTDIWEKNKEVMKV